MTYQQNKLLQNDLQVITKYNTNSHNKQVLLNKNGEPHQTRSDMLTKATPVLPLESKCSTHRECSYATQQMSLRIRENTMRVEQINKRITNL
jgi:hypothetical protein